MVQTVALGDSFILIKAKAETASLNCPKTLARAFKLTIICPTFYVFKCCDIAILVKGVGGEGGGGGLLRLAEPPERGCGGRLVEMVIICCIDLAVARAAGTHTHTHSCTHRHTVAWQKQTLLY